MMRSYDLFHKRSGHLVNVIVQCMMATYFELTSLARVKYPPHKPYIVVKYECAPLYDLFQKYIRQVIPSALFSVVTAL